MKTALVIPCTKSKSRPVESAMYFDALDSGDCTEVARQWLQAASQCKNLIAARMLYTGTGWNHALHAQKLLDTICELWIVSAGFGLVSADKPLPSYAATFAPQKDRVANRLIGFRSSSTAHTEWWKSINDANGHTQTPLQNTLYNYDRVVVALSASYLSALRFDLELLAHTLGPKRLWVVAVGANIKSLTPDLHSCLVPLTSEIERLISSPRTTLNLRALIWWLEEVVAVTGWDRDKQNHEIQRRLGALEPKVAFRKRTLDDDEVVRWLEKQKCKTDNKWPRGGKTKLLRTLRESGMSCEQNRFSRFYAEVTLRQ